MQTGGSGLASCSFEGVPCGDGVDLADGADAVIAGKDLVTEIAGVGAETPLVDAVVGAEGAATFGEDFELAPAAEREVVRASR
jgi:predicted homoserine dehydrogenase-like protein